MVCDYRDRAPDPAVPKQNLHILDLGPPRRQEHQDLKQGQEAVDQRLTTETQVAKPIAGVGEAAVISSEDVHFKAVIVIKIRDRNSCETDF